jgi:hypothetical protein
MLIFLVFVFDFAGLSSIHFGEILCKLSFFELRHCLVGELGFRVLWGSAAMHILITYI